MKEEKTVSLKEVFKFLIGNKWLYLIMFTGFLAVSLVGFNVLNFSKKEYSAFFDYEAAGFTTVMNDNGEEETFYIDGEKFDPRSIITKEKLGEYIASSEELYGLTAENLYKGNAVKSFNLTVVYKENDHKMDENDAAYIRDKKGYELVLNPSVLNTIQAKALAEKIANEVIIQSKSKIDDLNYSAYLTAYDQSISYGEKIEHLLDGVDILTNELSSLKKTYGDFKIEADYYGGEEDKYYLEAKTISAWESQMKIALNSFHLDSLNTELQVNGYVDASKEDYVVSIQTEIDNIANQISINSSLSEELKDQRNALIAAASSSSGANVTIDVNEYNSEMIALAKENANLLEKQKVYQLQLNKYNKKDASGHDMTDEQIAAYNASLSSFETKLSNVRNELEFYTKQYEQIAKKTMKDNSRVYFDNSDIISVKSGMRTSAIIIYSGLIAVCLPMAINLFVGLFRALESKPLFKKSKKEQ